MTSNFDYTDPCDNKYFSKALRVGIDRNKIQLNDTITKRVKILFWSSAVVAIATGSGLYSLFSFRNSIEFNKTIQVIEQTAPSKRSLAIAKKKAERISNKIVTQSVLESIPYTLALTLLSASGLWLLLLKPSFDQQNKIQSLLNQLIEDYKTIEFCNIPLDDLANKFSDLEGRDFTIQEVCTVLQKSRN
jgi:hypothetical protein